jgi:hypothetical protein
MTAVADRVRSRRVRLSGPVTVAGLALAGCAVLYVRDPNVPGAYGYCPFKSVTGLDCPFCGSLRAYHALLHGQLATAMNFNVLTVLALPFALGYWAVWLRRDRRGDPALPWRTDVVIGLGVLLVVFWVTRNLPFVPYLSSSR